MKINLSKKEREILSNCILCKMQDLSGLKYKEFVNQKELQKMLDNLQNLLEKLNS